MRYLNEAHIRDAGIQWSSITAVIRESVKLIGKGDFSQPLKPYLRFNNPKNRIIAMPAYVGGEINMAGIKWIASFPNNLFKQLPRAHSVVLLNQADTGVPLAMINTALLSGIRTAGVSSFMLDIYMNCIKRDGREINFGIIGFGPIGQLHMQLITDLYHERIGKIYLFDLKGIDKRLLEDNFSSIPTILCDSWQQVFDNSDVFITCTVAERRYVNLPPKKGALYLNVSLRDFEPQFLGQVDLVVVDNWEEVCRENTDIERAHVDHGMEKRDVFEITELEKDGFLADLHEPSVMFNPMGMAAFDIAIADYYYRLALKKNLGIDIGD